MAASIIIRSASSDHKIDSGLSRGILLIDITANSRDILIPQSFANCAKSSLRCWRRYSSFSGVHFLGPLVLLGDLSRSRQILLFSIICLMAFQVFPLKSFKILLLGSLQFSLKSSTLSGVQY